MAQNDFEAYEDSLLDDVPMQEPDDEVEYNGSFEDENDDMYDEPQDEDDVLTEFLKSQGIQPDLIKVETEDGIERVSFKDLDRDMQRDILQQIEGSNDLTADEINMINMMRNNNWTSAEYNDYIAQQALQHQAQQQPAPRYYSIDDFSDEELYVMDLQSKIPDLTEDEALEQLQNAKQNEELFNKITSGLRQDYQQREDQERQYAEQEILQQQAEQQRQFQESILNTIEQNREFSIGEMDMEMSDDDMNAVASFLLDSDQAGVRHIAKALNDTNALVQMAWFLTRGRDAFDTLNRYWKQQITERTRESYNRGVEDARSGKVKQAKAVVKKSNKKDK